jgi:hypothetical protein
LDLDEGLLVVYYKVALVERLSLKELVLLGSFVQVASKPVFLVQQGA